jgi:hypothetical protein
MGFMEWIGVDGIGRTIESSNHSTLSGQTFPPKEKAPWVMKIHFAADQTPENRQKKASCVWTATIGAECLLVNLSGFDADRSPRFTRDRAVLPWSSDDLKCGFPKYR